MTSKGAFRKWRVKKENKIMDDVFDELVAKDLEIVEILKKYLKFKNTTYSTIITLEIDAQENASDYEIVEEWLEKNG